MLYFNDVMKIHIKHYTAALGFSDIVAAVELESISSRDVAQRIVRFSDALIAQGAIDAENGLRFGAMDVDVYDIEKICVTICEFVDAQGYGDLIGVG
jgi:hypothetical protein